MNDLDSADLERTRVLKEGRECERVHVWLYSEDVRWIDQNIDKVKRSKFIRLCVQRIIRSIVSKAGDDSEILHAEEEAPNE